MQSEAGEDPDRHQRTGQSRQHPCQLIAAGMWCPGNEPDEPVAWADQIYTGEESAPTAEGATNASPAKP